MKIGIDLGTTFSACAYLRNGQPEIIVNKDGSRLTPSVVMVEADGTVVVGEAAKSQAVIAAHSVVVAVKNYMGKEKEFQLGDGNVYTPEMISSFILQRLFSDAQSYVGEPVDGAVITIPAYFTDAQRKATEDAAALAELPLLATINEPTAAAIYYASRLQEEKPLNILVYDLGGGTFDVTVIRAQGMQVKVLGTHGLSGVGGKLFDQSITDYVCDIFAEKYEIDLEDEEYVDEYQDLMLKAETCKIQLSAKTEASIAIRIGKIKESILISRDFLNEQVQKLYLRTESSIKKALRDADLSFDALDRVVCVGGSSKIPYIRQQLERLCGMAPISDVNPDEAVALGAAIYANLPEHAGISDVCSHSIGIVVIDAGLQEANHILIARNTTLPCAVEETLYTTVQNQRSVRLTITEGEFAEMSDVTCVASETLSLVEGLPKGSEVVVRLSLDSNQLLHLHVKIPAVGFLQEYTIRRTSNIDTARLVALRGLVLNRTIL